MSEPQKRFVKQPAGVLLCEMPGLVEALAAAEHRQFITRENSLLGLTYDLCGERVRTMTIADYVVLERTQSPFIRRIEPSRYDVAMFLWVMSPQFKLWSDGIGWRGLFPSLEPLAAFFHGLKIKWKFLRDCPKSSEQVVLKAFEYIDEMFYDAPPSVSGGGESCLSYLTGWFDALQSEYHFPSEAIWKMGLPELFQRLNAIRQRHNPNMPTFNKKTDELKMWVVNGLREKRFTLDELRDGKVAFPKPSNN